MVWRQFSDSGNSDSKQQAENHLGEARIRSRTIADAAGRKDVVRTDPIALCPIPSTTIFPRHVVRQVQEYSLLNDLNGPIVPEEGRSLQNVAIVLDRSPLLRYKPLL
jgi:hypothetical protein